jgi:hypothetical protein
MLSYKRCSGCERRSRLVETTSAPKLAGKGICSPYLAFVINAVDADNLLEELVEGGVGRRVTSDLEEGSEDVA